VAGPLRLAVGDVPLAQEPSLGLGHCGRVASSRGDTGSPPRRWHPVISRGEILEPLKQKRAGVARCPGTFRWADGGRCCFASDWLFGGTVKAQPASAVTRHAALLPAAWKLLLHQL